MEVENISRGEFLTDDIIEVNILPLLPVKSLFRFKSVCQRWKTLISHNILPTPPNIVHYFPVCGKLTFLSVEGNLVGTPDLSLDFIRSGFDMIIASCNGLLAFHHNGRRKFFYYLCNPVTQEMNFIPNLPKTIGLPSMVAGLAFDPSKDSPCYKLVLPILMRNPQKPEYHFQVFSSDTGTWKISRAKIILSSGYYLCSHSRSFYIGGFLYWKTGSSDIVEFNPDGNSVSVIPFEDCMVVKDDIMMGEWEGRLALTIRRGGELEIWIMNEHRQFSKTYSIGIEMIFGDSVIETPLLWPLPCDGGKVVLFQSGMRVFSYDPKTGELKMFMFPDTIPFFRRRYFYFIVYKKSLVPIPKTN
ncbi:F-box protein At5g49610-like [Tasmannia lanceolata]|uniref:F-box protein At5g49610-like n=1 Tax=Tasmannia lanceolata TaxID=3420 RepID=UPI004062DC45